MTPDPGIAFRRVTADDLPTLADWLRRPHVARWWGEGVTRFLIDPAPDNAAARRAYAKAGFVEVARGTHMDGPYVLMVLDLQPAEAE